jgi:two-component system sensor histidine kinase AlgZ
LADSTVLPTPPSSPRSYWLCQLAFWGGNAVLEAWALIFLLPESNAQVGLILYGTPGPPPQVAHWTVLALQAAAFNAAGLLLTHFVRRYVRRRGWDRLRAASLAPRVLAVGLVPGLPFGAARTPFAIAALRGTPPDAPVALQLFHQGINESLVLWIWCTAYFLALGARRRRSAELQRSELTRALQAAELRLLKSQLNPHFLFNSLNSVRALIADDPARAQQAVTQLSRTLRYTLSPGQDELVSLKQELEIVEDYLALEALRLGQRLRIERDISAAAERTSVPVMLLQTVVENAIKHGIAELPEGGALRIAARVEDGALRLEVENPRPATGASSDRNGIGLRNAAERLRLLFGDGARLDLDLSAPRRALARIRIPLPA